MSDMFSIINEMKQNEPTEVVDSVEVQECRACMIRNALPLVPDSLLNTVTIWQFPPFCYQTDDEADEAFRQFVPSPVLPEFYCSYNEEGYTYMQWQVYYLSKNRHDCKSLHASVLRLFRVLAKYPFFDEMIKMGTRADPLHTTLHHFTKYMERAGWRQTEMLDLLMRHNLSLDDEDSEGVTPRDNLSCKFVQTSDLNRANSLTKAYKERERQLFSDVLGDRCKKCNRCNDWIDPYGCLEEVLRDEDVKSRVLGDIDAIIGYRTKCNEIYRTYLFDSSPIITRHQYLIDWYKRL
uniref:Uncharacterized protein n=1 Tax=viral metagenome TaxID=1070528 RepID=A0A6C0KFS9_9ZZZZ